MDKIVTFNETAFRKRIAEEQRKLRKVNGLQKGNLWYLTAGRESGVSLASSFFAEFVVEDD